MSSLRVVGPGRAGESFRRALARAGWHAEPSLRSGDEIAAAAHGVDLLLLAVPDPVVAEVARAVAPVPATVVAHVAGSLTLDVLAPHERRASIHPLVPLATPEVGADHLVGAWFAIAGDEPDAADLVRQVVSDLRGRSFTVDDEHRVAHHAAACVAANHLAALLGQVERVGAAAGAPLAAYLDLVQASLDAVRTLGPTAALTGPVARGDWATIERHLAALDPSEHAAYRALADAAARLAGTGPSPWRSEA